MANASKDQNFVSTLLGVSSADGVTPVALEVNPQTGALLVTGESGGGSGGTLVSEPFDYVAATYPNSTTEVYTYKFGGSAGTTVATVTVTYNESAKTNLNTITKV